MSASHVANDAAADYQKLLTYVVDLELEVDRLRRQSNQFRQESRALLAAAHTLLGQSAVDDQTAAELRQSARHFSEALAALEDSPLYPPASDAVIAVALRPMIEQVFRWQRQFFHLPAAVLHLDLKAESFDWFPIRMRHILDNLISNSLRYHDAAKGELRVTVGAELIPEGLQLRVSDNGLGMPWDKRREAFDLYYRSATARSLGLGVGLAVVKLLAHQSGGSLHIESIDGQGTSCTVTLPYFDKGDFLEF